MALVKEVYYQFYDDQHNAKLYEKNDNQSDTDTASTDTAPTDTDTAPTDTDTDTGDT